MSKISYCPKCGGLVVEPAYEGDGAYPVPGECRCGTVSFAEALERDLRQAGKVEIEDGPYYYCGPA